MRATETEIWLHPYLLRQVCSNGAIMAHAVDSLRVEHAEFDTQDDLIRELREAIAACCAKDVFITTAEEVRSSVDAEADLVLNLAPLFLQFQDAASQDILLRIVERFSSDRDQSRFSLMNAVTSVARDTRDPEQRWRLEELGGGIGAGVVPEQPSGGYGLQRTPSELVKA